MHVIDEEPFTVGWLEDRPAWMQRAAHAVAEGGRVWVIDPFDAPGAEERVRALGEPAGVLQLLDRHGRDCAAWAGRLGVPHHVVPRDLPGVPFDLLPIPAVPGWKEAAAWFPSTGTLVVADALAAAPGYVAPGERVAVHGFLRARAPRVLGTLPVEHLLLGHGEGLHGPAAAAAIQHALDSSVRQIPAFVVGSVLRGVRGALRR